MIKAKIFGAVLLTFLLTVALYAAPARVGVVRIEKAGVTLNGRTISTPQLLEEGQTLVLAKGAAVRLQLLGGAGEVSFTGPKTLRINRDSLIKQAKKVQRGGVASVPDIGNTTRGATSTVRKLALPTIRVSAPPSATQGGWSFPVSNNPAQGQARPVVAEWTLSSLWLENSDEVGPSFRKKELLDGKIEPGQEFVTVPTEVLQWGTRYMITLTLIDEKTDYLIGMYERPFRLLSEGEATYLGEAARELREESRQSASVNPLIELASLYLEWDQLSEARQTMDEAREHPKWGELKPEVKNKADDFERQMKKIWGELATE